MKLMLSCKEASVLVSLSCERRLTWRETMALKMHLLMCQACTRFARQITFLRSAALRFAETCAGIDTGTGLPEPVRQRIAKALRQVR